MSSSRRRAPRARGSFSRGPGAKRDAFTSPLARGMCEAVPGAKDPVEAVLWHARLLTLESGITAPPFRPASYAHLRRVRRIVYREMEVEGRLLPQGSDFVIELRKDRPRERQNFTCAHELGHVFFYDAVPALKYRGLASAEPHHDEQEEKLCNIAAAELLMPAAVFSKVAGDFSPSPQSLQEVARLFEASLTATVLRLHGLEIWDATFILWQNRGGALVANWMARPGRGLTHFPPLAVGDAESSGIYEASRAGKATAGEEWLTLDKQYRLCQVQSVCLPNSSAVLSCIAGHTPAPAGSRPRHAPGTLPLPLEYGCTCDGSGWRSFKKDGRSYAARCRAARHVARAADSSPHETPSPKEAGAQDAAAPGLLKPE